MIYITYEDMCRDIRQNLTKIPRDVCGVVGVPRSGMLPATIIAEQLNIGLATVDEFIDYGRDAFAQHGGRPLRRSGGNKILVVDDTCFHGNALSVIKNKLIGPSLDDYELIYLVVYLEGPCDRLSPDIYLRDIREESKGGPFGWALYEWNIFAHGRLTDRTLFDLDGVICCEPPDERDIEAYEEYIKNPTPLHVPTGKINICTYRLEKYADVTIDSLDTIGVDYVTVTMAKDRGVPAWKIKADMYAKGNWLLFIESSDWQARKIHEETGKPVICIETNKLYC